MRNTKFRHLCAAFIAVTALQSFMVPQARTEELQDWQKGVIEGAFIFSPHLRSKDIRVDVQNDCAILKGYVDSQVSRALAEQLALSVKGINEVVNKLVVAPEQWNQPFRDFDVDSSSLHRLSNVTITNKVRSQLLANRVTSGMEIDVETRNRVVTLSGAVNSEAEKVLTYWLVKNTPGVIQVVDRLEVSPSSTQQAAVVQLGE